MFYVRVIKRPMCIDIWCARESFKSAVQSLMSTCTAQGLRHSTITSYNSMTSLMKSFQNIESDREALVNCRKLV